jgi:hypothetical protein
VPKTYRVLATGGASWDEGVKLRLLFAVALAAAVKERVALVSAYRRSTEPQPLNAL